MSNEAINPHSGNSTDSRYDQQVTAQAIDFLYANMRTIMFSIVLMPIAMVIVMWEYVSHPVLIAWFCAVAGIIIWRLLLSRKYLHCPPVPEDAPRWGRYFAFTSLASGLLWGGASILFFEQGSVFVLVFIYTCIFGLAVGSINVSAYWLESYYAFTIPALSLSALRLLWEGSGYQWLGLLVIMFMFILIRLARNTHASALEAIRLRFENLELVEELRGEKEIAEAASRDKTRFLASASHDLRQPIHALSLYSEALSHLVPPGKAATLLSNMGRSIEAIQQLLGSLLDISKLDAGIVQPELQHFSMQGILRQMDEEYAMQAKGKGLDWQMGCTDMVVYSDPALLETILRNLISNAIRYTHAGRVEVTCSQIGTSVELKVTDTGLGIPATQREAIFREFFQIANPERDRAQGLGLGLSIVERLARLLDCKVELESEVGKGSCFSITVPGGDADVAKETYRKLIIESPANELEGMKVLVLDDEAALRESMRMALEGWGCEVCLAADEDEAITSLQEGFRPQAVIVDFRLRENLTGVHAIDSFREIFGLAVPALIVTGDTHPDRLREAKASGHTLMHKPVKPGQLRTWLRYAQRSH